MWHLAVPAWSLVVRSVVIYVGLLLALRLFGKREVGQFTLFDLVLVLLAANAVQPAMTGPDASLGGGLIIMATLFLLNLVVSRFVGRSARIRRLLEGEPTIIAQNGAWLDDALRRQGLEPEDCVMALREHGVSDVSEVGLAVLETDGTISVVPVETAVRRGKRRVRTRRLL